MIVIFMTRKHIQIPISVILELFIYCYIFFKYC